jgi:phosphoenolpyruvate phosphomutase
MYYFKKVFEMKKVYTCFCVDIIHEGHLNIINKAAELGELTVGLLCESEMVRYNRFPIHTLQERVSLISAIPNVKNVIIQHTIMYDSIFETEKPDIIVHGDDWKTGPQKVIRENVLKNIKKYGGELVEFPYTYNENVAKTDKRLQEMLGMPEYRRPRLKKLLDIVPIVKTIEAHSGLTGLIAEKTVVSSEGGLDQFEAMWVSSLCDSTEKGKPDIEVVDLTSRLRTINDIMEVTTKPIIFDGDTGGLVEHFVYTVRTLERLGVSAVIIEDKVGLKKNSLFGTEVEQSQDGIGHFCEKIKAGKKAQLTDDFMIIARIESLILEKGMEDALDRAFEYIEAGADGIMIHSRKKEPTEIFQFCKAFRLKNKTTPLVVVPTSYNQVTENELIERGVNIVIYANQLIRSAFPSMKKTAEDILIHHRAKEVDDRLMSINNIISLIDEL